ncbi:glycoside hydrolase family 131 protein [Aspergillus lucknowensis]|uniref:Glycoside hydrolase 131 catalytic N-terminal domain-containing protein n=1 Tax=Aspergillus lucknowensis TaxID=176173 RepID=A0ABR4LU43_9EURO
MKSTSLLLSGALSATVPLVSAGEIIWSGIFNESYTVENFDEWSWSNQVPPWQWYIHGSGDTATYLEVSPDFRNPDSTLADEAKGVRITIDDTSSWNGQTMMRSELIPQTTEDLGSGTLFYHFSLSVPAVPDETLEHQLAFFESHFTEIKYGGADGTSLSWYAGGTSQWTAELKANTWYNFAYGIDFSASTVALYASTGADPLEQVVEGVSASTSTNSADWHVGELRLDNGNAGGSEDWYWSGVYIESGDVTVDV